MKRFFVFLFFCSFFFFAAAKMPINYVSDKEIKNYFENYVVPANTSVIVKSRETMLEYPSFEFVVLEVVKNAQDAQTIQILVKDGFIFPEAIDIKSNASLREKVENKLMQNNLRNIYKKETKENIIMLGNSKNPALIIFSDPECPFCKKKLGNIEKTLLENSVKMILTPVHELSSLEKSALIYEEVAKAKNDEQKIKILRKYFNQNTAPLYVDSEKISRIDALRQKYFKAGLNSVPVIIMEENIVIE